MDHHLAAGASGSWEGLTINTTLVAVRMVFTFHDLPIGVKMKRLNSFAIRLWEKQRLTGWRRNLQSKLHAMTNPARGISGLQFGERFLTKHGTTWQDVSLPIVFFRPLRRVDKWEQW
jgi:hypothetical protein